jgi:CRP-like cAMP-binding protein
LFRNFTDTGVQILATIAQEKPLPEGTPLFVENMLGEALYVIVEGRIRIGARGTDGREKQLVVLEAPESLGEAALLRVGPRLCSATAEVPSLVLEIARRDLAQLQRTKPQACLKLMMGVVELLGARMRDADPEMKRLIGPGDAPG